MDLSQDQRQHERKGMNMFPQKRIRMVVGVLCVFGMAPVTSCIAESGREWDVSSPITVDIKRSAQQVWHPIGREVILQARASDHDRWRYIEGCSEWEDVHNISVFNYSWTGSVHLVPPTDDYKAKWYTIEYTPEEHTVTVTVNDDSLTVDPPDTGSRDDSQDATDEVTLGAFDVKGSLTVSGTNCAPITMYAWWSQHDESMHYTDPDWVEAEPLFGDVPLVGGPITLGELNPEDTDITDVSTPFPTITFRAQWVLSSEPDGVWTSDQTHWAGCLVDQMIWGALKSEVWDEDVDTFLFGDYVAFTPAVPSFQAPISWNWDRILWDLIALAATANEAEGATGLGMVFQSDFFAGSSNWQNHSEVKHQSKDHTFWGATPHSKTTPMSYGPSGEWWQFDTSAGGGNSIELRGDIQGKVEIVEFKRFIYEPPDHWEYWNAYAKAWSEGLIGFWLDDPYYGGMPQPPDDGYLP